MRYLLALLVLLSAGASAQQPEVYARKLPDYGHASDQASIEQALRRARAFSRRLQAERGPRLLTDHHTVEHKWPVRKGILVGDVHIQTIDAFFDNDNTNGPFLDWDCGNRSYDGHNGTDISMKPYTWWRMRRDHGIIVAAADGVIMDKVDDQPEESCDFGTEDGDNNVIVLEHADGSQSVYAHMRTGSLTRKPLGASVEAGDYLGVIGSAGISTGPHLHFGVGFWEQQGNVLRFVEQDPWDGLCNAAGNSTWWEEQPPYLVPNLMSLATHDQAPENPPCPQSEKPHFKDRFDAGDPVVYSVVIRDQLAGVMADVAIKRPNGSNFVTLQVGDPNLDRPGGTQWTTAPINLPASPQAGEWTLQVTMGNEVLSHSFWVEADPETPDPIAAGNNQYNGLWYDPGLDGEGYNFVTTPNGTVIYFYGSDKSGERLWMISETIREAFTANAAREIIMFESTGGVFEAPVKSARALSAWGTLTLTLEDCGNGTAVLRGTDGEKTSDIRKLAGVPGTGCTNGQRSDRAQSGLWFNPALDGEGFNLIVAPNGVVIYYYGFDKDGNRLWLISTTIPGEIDDGAEHVAGLFRADSGTFDAPVPSKDSLVKFGDLTLKVNGCDSMDYDMVTDDGNKSTGTVRLAGIVGLDC